MCFNFVRTDDLELLENDHKNLCSKHVDDTMEIEQRDRI